MTSPRLRRSPLVLLLGFSSLVFACSDGGGDVYGPVRHYGTGGGSSTGGSDGTSGGATSGGSMASSGSSSTGNGATSSGTGNPSGNTENPGSTSGSTGTGSTGTGTADAGTTSTPPPPVTPAFSLTVDNASPTLKLVDSTVLNVSITPQSWSGAVALTVTGLPSDVTATFDNASINVSGTTAATAKLTLKSVSSTAPVATPFKIVGTVSQVVQNAAATVTVKPEITINIPVNADSMSGGFGTVNITAPADIANNPVIVNIVNLDSTPHEVHAENKNGFNHGAGTFGQGQADSPVRKVTATGSYAWHLHDNAPPGGPADSHVVIQ